MARRRKATRLRYGSVSIERARAGSGGTSAGAVSRRKKSLRSVQMWDIVACPRRLTIEVGKIARAEESLVECRAGLVASVMLDRYVPEDSVLAQVR